MALALALARLNLISTIIFHYPLSSILLLKLLLLFYGYWLWPRQAGALANFDLISTIIFHYPLSSILLLKLLLLFYGYWLWPRQAGALALAE
jgi:cbb3-type cytochrome oxidase subunit 3